MLERVHFEPLFCAKSVWGVVLLPICRDIGFCSSFLATDTQGAHFRIGNILRASEIDESCKPSDQTLKTKAAANSVHNAPAPPRPVFFRFSSALVTGSHSPVVFAPVLASSHSLFSVIPPRASSC